MAKDASAYQILALPLLPPPLLLMAFHVPFDFDLKFI